MALISKRARIVWHSSTGKLGIGAGTAERIWANTGVPQESETNFFVLYLPSAVNLSDTEEGAL